jgi:hypothetical protein
VGNELDLRLSVYDLTEKYPQLIDILKFLGFTALTNPLARNTVGRKMTIPKGCQMRGLSLEQVLTGLEEAGFIIIGKEQGS